MSHPTIQAPTTLFKRKGQRASVKRSKTYSGCWTCRARKVKCDEAKPSCQRCKRAAVPCQGYQVKLIWDLEEEGHCRSVSERRSLLNFKDGNGPVLSMRSLHIALDKVNSSDGVVPVQEGPFGVFSASSAPRSPVSDIENTADDGCPLIEEICDEDDNITVEEITDVEYNEDDEDDVELCPPSYEATDTLVGGTSTTMTTIKQQILPNLQPYLISASQEDRKLLSYWITDLSGMMIPTKRQDNPFQTIYIPLALASFGSNDSLSGNTALLHSIYALSAFNCARLSSASRDYYLSLGTKHHQVSLQHLQRNILRTPDGQNEALLATIITMCSIDVVNGTSSSWRVHLSGGRSWLNMTSENIWAMSTSANTLRQLFTCVEILGFDRGRVASHKPHRLKPAINVDMDTNENRVDHVTLEGYMLDKIWGITLPIFNALTRIKNLLERDHAATDAELDELERHIRLNDPDASLSDLDKPCDELSQHHACSFYCACLIYFYRVLRHAAPCRLQHLVRRSLYHLEAINKLKTGLNVNGLLWPVFIVACEVEASSGLRELAIRLFEKGQLQGIGNMSAAATVVLEVWRRRDEEVLGAGIDIDWRDVMNDLEIDVLLT